MVAVSSVRLKSSGLQSGFGRRQKALSQPLKVTFLTTNLATAFSGRGREKKKGGGGESAAAAAAATLVEETEIATSHSMPKFGIFFTEMQRQ